MGETTSGPLADCLSRGPADKLNHHGPTLRRGFRLQRIGEPDGIAAAIAFLLFGDARYVTTPVPALDAATAPPGGHCWVRGCPCEDHRQGRSL